MDSRNNHFKNRWIAKTITNNNKNYEGIHKH